MKGLITVSEQWLYIHTVLGCYSTGIEKGDEVSVYADLDGKCHRGLVKPFDGRKVFVGNGNAVLARNDIFCFHQNVR